MAYLGRYHFENSLYRNKEEINKMIEEGQKNVVIIPPRLNLSKFAGGFSVQGITELKRYLDAQVAARVKAMNDCVKDAAYLMQREVKASIGGQRGEPKSWDTGTLLRSVHTRNIAPGEYEVFTDIEYAPYVEYGGAGERK